MQRLEVPKRAGFSPGNEPQVTMGKALIIAEKPSVANDIAKVLGGFKKVADLRAPGASAKVERLVGSKEIAKRIMEQVT